VNDQKTLQVYAEKASDYAALTEDFNATDPGLQAFIAAMPAGGHVLDLGCGPGAAAAQMAKAGLSVDAYDPVPQMVDLARRHPGVDAQLAGFDDVSGVAVYDGIWANFSLLHARRAELPGHLGRIARALKPGGRFHIAVKTGTGEDRDNLGRFYTYYMEPELTGLLEDAGLTVSDRREGCDRGLSGKKEPWIALVAHA
jgi:SAM-dependent methyltransferase